MTQYEELLAQCRRSGCAYEEQSPLSSRTSFRVGGPAPLLLLPQTEDQLAGLLRTASAAGQELFVLGRGSNLLVRDGGLEGPAVHLSPEFEGGPRLLGEGKVWCPAGAKLSQLCRFAQVNGLTGLEFAYGIPGSVGGALYMNAGAYGGEMKDVTVRVRALDAQGQVVELPAEECAFSYRESVFSQPQWKGGCITGGVFALSAGDPEEIRARMEEILQRRRDKQPLEWPSAGSTFKRPEGAFASALIDQCGLKGLRVGDAMVSEKHAGFVINCGQATAFQILELMDQVVARVQSQTGFVLEPEVRIVGRDPQEK